MSETIPERWESTWNDWRDSLSGYAWKDTAKRAVLELGAAEAQLAAKEAEIALLRPDALWAATHRSELADLRAAFAKSESSLAAKERVIRGLVEVANLYDEWEAALLLSSEAWDAGNREFPEVTPELWQGLLAIQTKRNAALLAAGGKDAPPEATR